MNYYIVHLGTGTIIATDECIFVAVDASNIDANTALDDDDAGKLIEEANLSTSWSELRPPIKWLKSLNSFGF